MFVVRVIDFFHEASSPTLTSVHELHRVLRPHLSTNLGEYISTMKEIQKGGGKTIIACRDDNQHTAIGLAVARSYRDTFSGIRYYCDDLVSLPAQRSKGAGKALTDWMKKDAKSLGCNYLSLESGTARVDAHRFYFREGFVIPSFSFRSKL